MGVGGAAARDPREEANPDSRTEKNASHTTPLTVAAELGVVGLAAYLAFLLGAVWLLLQTYRVDRALGLGLAAAFLVLVVHSLVYSGFFEDPLTWATLALGSGALAAYAVAPASVVERLPAQGAPTPAGAAHGPGR